MATKKRARKSSRKTGKKGGLRGLGAIRTYDNGAFYSTSFGEREISDFRRTWPGSGLGGLYSVWAQFDRKSGDLVDLQCNGRGSCEQFDGAAFLALTHDMQCAATRPGSKAKAPKDHCRR